MDRPLPSMANWTGRQQASETMNDKPSTDAPASTLPNLPPFLRRRNGRLESVFHPTAIQTYKVCQLKFWLSRGLEIERAVPRWSLNYGGAIHEALAYRYTQDTDPGTLLSKIEPAQLALLEAWFAKVQVADAEWRTLDRAVSAIQAYNAAYPVHDWTVLGVEEEFEVYVGDVVLEAPMSVEIDPVESVTRKVVVVPCYLAGRKDLVVAWHDGVWVVDHKTCSEWGSDPETNQELLSGRRSFQFRGYAWAERAVKRQRVSEHGSELANKANQRDWLPVRGVVGNYIVGRKPFSEAASAVKRRSNGSTKPRDEHHQEFFTFKDDVLDEWRDQFLAVAARILRDWQSGQWESSFDRGCAHYGRCEFYDYCEESPATRDATLESALYRRKEPATTTITEDEP